MEPGLDTSVLMKSLIENISIVMISLKGMTTKAGRPTQIHLMFLKD